MADQPTDFPPGDWPQVAALFDEVADLPAAERAAWLQALPQRAPAVPATVAAQVARLLTAHASHETGDWLAAGPAVPHLALQAPHGALAPGEVLGRWRLLARVAQGGMGEVWQAEPVAGPAGRVVALKLPLLARPDSAALARFQREGELLATLQHPHIARLLDAGHADDGTPWLAMDWVAGTDLLQWAQQAGLTTRQRLQLFLQVADAVAHAHSRLVIHRDLKPSNILVERDTAAGMDAAGDSGGPVDAGTGQVKLLDFGIAKLLQPDAGAADTALTQAAGRVLTTAYAAPEQVRGDVLTPAADVYALGVVLFELLTGQRPYRLAFHSAAQLEQAVEAADVRRVSSVCPQWPRALRVDLDAVLGKALQHAPDARYAGARGLADDLRRHLAGQPVLAQPPHAAYLLRKALQRHRVAAAGVAATLVAVLAGGALAAWQAQRATQARDQALAAQQRSRVTQDFLVDLIGDAARTGQPLQAAQLLARAEALARQQLQHTPDQLAAVLGIVGQNLDAWQPGPRGAQLLDEATTLSRDPDLQAELACEAALAGTQRAAPDAARALLRRHADDPARDPGVRLRCALTLAQLLIQNGDLAEAAQRVQAADAQLQAGQGGQANGRATDWKLATWVLTMQLYLRADGRAQGLDARAEAQVAQLKAMARERSSIAMGLYNTWGTLANVSGEPEKALQRWSHVVETARQDDPQQQVLPYHLAMLAQAEIGVGDYAQASGRLQQVLQAAERGKSDADRYTGLCNLGRVAGLQGDDARARALFARALAVPDHGEPLRRNAAQFCAMGQVEAALGAGRLADAASLLEGAEQARGDLALVPRPARTGWQALQAELAWRQGDAARAEQLARQWLADARALQADNRHSARVGMAAWMLALALRAEGRTAEAEAQAAEARSHLQATVRPGHRWRRWAEAG